MNMSSDKKIEVKLIDADGFAADSSDSILVLHISRSEIENLNFTSALERLMVMTDSRESVLRYRESLLFEVTGFHGDRRELPEIPEVRAYFKRLTQEWPHWFWFLHRDAGMISLLLSLLCRVKMHKRAGAFGIEFANERELSATVGDLLERGIALFEAFDIDPELAQHSAESALAELGA